MDERKVEYLKARRAGDIGAMATIIRQGLPATIIGEGLVSTYEYAAVLAREHDDFALVDALLSRTDIREVVCAELFSKGMASINLLRYLEAQGVDLTKLIRGYSRDIFVDLLENYSRIMCIYGGEQCEELCMIIELFKSRGGDSVKAYEWLASDREREDPMNRLGEDCFDRVARLLKPKGGRQWRNRS